MASDRVIIKPMDRRWHVYNCRTGSFPLLVPGYGEVQPDSGFKTEEEANSAAERYAEFLSGVKRGT